MTEVLTELIQARAVARRYFWSRHPAAGLMAADLAKHDWLARGGPTPASRPGRTRARRRLRRAVP